ncbi:hypothetical protein Tco_1577328 [Tanacetum coccineum]
MFGTVPTTIPDTTPSVIPPSTYIDTALTPTSPDYTPASPDYSPASDTEFDPSEDPSSDHIPPLPATSPFLSSTDDLIRRIAKVFINSCEEVGFGFWTVVMWGKGEGDDEYDILDTPPSPTHGKPFTETTLSTQRSLVASGALRRRVMVLAPGQPIPHGRPYRYHLNGPVHMMTVRKRVRPLPTHRLAVRHSVDYSSSDHFVSDDSLRDSSSSLSSSSSSETSSDPYLDDLSDSLSDHSLPTPLLGMRPSHHLCSLVPSIPRSSTAISDRPSYDSSFASPSRKRSRSLATSVPLSSPIPRALSYGRADLLPSLKRVRSPESVTDLEVSLAEGFEPSKYRGTKLNTDDDVVRSDGIDIVPEIQAEIDECIAYADSLRDRGIDARVVVEAVDREEIDMGTRGPVEVRVDRVTHPVIADNIPKPDQEERAVEVTYKTLGDLVQRFHDYTEEIPVQRVQAIKSVQKDQGYRIVATGQQSADMLERIRELEQDNRRLRDMIDVASQRVTWSQRRELRVQREMRQIWHFRFYDCMRIASL